MNVAPTLIEIQKNYFKPASLYFVGKVFLLHHAGTRIGRDSSLANLSCMYPLKNTAKTCSVTLSRGERSCHSTSLFKKKMPVLDYMIY